MPDVLALIAKSVFEANHQGREPDDVLPIDRYTSTHKAFEPLSDGGRIFLVTVRPGNEALWLVGVLVNPKKESGAWVSAKNTVPIKDVSNARAKLRFESGSGLSAKKGALGMSLQTPRQLTPHDVTLLLGEAPRAGCEETGEATDRAQAAVSAPRSAPTAKAAVRASPSEPTAKAAVRASPSEPTALAAFAESTPLHLSARSGELLEIAATAPPAEIRAALDPARLFANELRQGLVDEWAHPGFDAATRALSFEPRFHEGYESSFPFAILKSQARDRLVVAGPRGVVRDLPLTLPAGGTDIWSAWKVEDDVLVFFKIGPRLEAAWMSAPGESFALETPFERMQTAAGLGLTNGGPAVTPGVRAKKAFANRMAKVWIEDGRFYRLTRSETFDATGQGESKDGRVEEFDPKTGAAKGTALPPWLSSFATNGARIHYQSSVHPLPEHAPEPASGPSPLGGSDGKGGLRIRREGDGALTAEAPDGRAWRGEKDAAPPIALLRFPERDAIHAVYEKHVMMRDGKAVLGPAFGAAWPQTQEARFLDYAVPRDRSGSRALRDITDDAARGIYEVAERAFARRSRYDLHDGEPHHHRALAYWPELADAVSRALPELRDPGLVAGVVVAAIRAVEHGALWARTACDHAAWREKLGALVAEVTGTHWTDRSAQVLDTFFQPQGPRAPLPLHLLAVDEHLFGDGVRDDAISAREEIAAHASRASGEPRYVTTTGPGCDTSWEALVNHAGHMVFRLLAPGTPIEQKKKLRDVLALWGNTRLAARPEELRYLSVKTRADVLPWLDGRTHAASFLVHGASRYYIRSIYAVPELVLRVIERAEGGLFTDLPGVTIERDDRPARAWRCEGELGRALALYDERGSFPIDKDAIAAIAEGTGLSVATAGFVWAAAIKPWDTASELRKAVGATAAERDRALKDVSHIDFDSLYAEAMPERASQLFAPLTKGPDGESAVERFVRVWNEQQGKRPRVPEHLIKQIEIELAGATIPASQAVRVLAEPEAWGNLTKDARWVVRPYREFASNQSFMRGFIPAGWPKPESMGEEQVTSDLPVFDGRALRYYLRYVPWAYQDLPSGDPLRAGIARLTGLVRARLENPDLLLLAGAVDLSRQTDRKKLAADFAALAAHFSGDGFADYRAVDADRGGKSAPGRDRGDIVFTWPAGEKNGAFVSFRPAKVKDEDALARLCRALGVEKTFRETRGGCACGLNFGRFEVIDVTDLAPWLVLRTEGFRALSRALMEDALPVGRYASDPRIACPELVAETRARHDLSEDAAAMFLMLATLADPTPLRVSRILGASPSAHDELARALLAKGLVTEEAVPRTTRRLFLAGEARVTPRPPAAPLEARKARLYGLDPDPGGPPDEIAARVRDARAPFGVVLPLRPFRALYEDAMARR